MILIDKQTGTEYIICYQGITRTRLFNLTTGTMRIIGNQYLPTLFKSK